MPTEIITHVSGLPRTLYNFPQGGYHHHHRHHHSSFHRQTNAFILYSFNDMSTTDLYRMVQTRGSIGEEEINTVDTSFFGLYNTHTHTYTHIQYTHTHTPPPPLSLSLLLSISRQGDDDHDDHHHSSFDCQTNTIYFTLTHLHNRYVWLIGLRRK